MFTDAAVKEIARIALERGTGARGLRAVVEEVLEGVLFDPEPGARYVITDKTVRGGEPVRQSMSQTRAPLSWHVLRRLRVNERPSTSEEIQSGGMRNRSICDRARQRIFATQACCRLDDDHPQVEARDDPVPLGEQV